MTDGEPCHVPDLAPVAPSFISTTSYSTRLAVTPHFSSEPPPQLPSPPTVRGERPTPSNPQPPRTKPCPNPRSSPPRTRARRSCTRRPAPRRPPRTSPRSRWRRSSLRRARSGARGCAGAVALLAAVFWRVARRVLVRAPLRFRVGGSFRGLELAILELAIFDATMETAGTLDSAVTNADKFTVHGRTADRMRDPSMKTAETFNNDCLISLVLNCAVGCGWMYASPQTPLSPLPPLPTCPKISQDLDLLTRPQMGHAAAQQDPPAVRHQGLHH